MGLEFCILYWFLSSGIASLGPVLHPQAVSPEYFLVFYTLHISARVRTKDHHGFIMGPSGNASCSSSLVSVRRLSL